MSFVATTEELIGTSLSGNSSSALATTTQTSIMRSIKTQRGGISESSTTSDNTTDFIDIVKKHDIVYNTHHPDYKNVEIKLKVWTQIAEEIGLSVDASKRKWKNLRDSYTKYLRSFRVGTKTSKKYQFWAHAEHMDFLKPYQGPGRSSTNVTIAKDDEDNECDLGYQVVSKASANSVDEEDLKQNSIANNIMLKNVPISAASISNMMPNYATNTGGIKTSGIGLSIPSSGGGAATGTSSLSGTIMLPVPSLPTVQLPPSLTAKPILASISTSSSTSSASAASSMCNTSHSYTTSASLASLTSTSMPSQVFALPQLSAKGPIPMPSSNTASSVGCLIIEPQLFASADTFKKEFSNSSSVYTSSSTAQITPSGLQIYPNVTSHMSATSQTMANRLNSPLITKIRRVQPSPQSSAINLSFSTTPSSSASATSALTSQYQTNGFTSTLANSFMPALGGSTTITATTTTNGGGVGVPPPIKKLKSAEVDISAILQANRDLDANTLFFLSLARSVRSMPTKFQSLAKMRCMRIVSDIELELDNVSNEANSGDGHTKYCTNDTDSPPTAAGNNINEIPQSEHFVYVMSPSRVESMIDLSSDDENPANSGN
ncbi:serine-rich adhesin for platelets [Calliphora vicina]|uniref:serine-rich adhesin for platelets n=1 Tax=Calliphora vicina TaxID=7373 RepID=UPI00325A52A8